MSQINVIFLIMAVLLFVSVVASRLSARLGMPLLLVFLGVGMLAGEEGIGGIAFYDLTATTIVSQLALAIILLDGGLRTQFETFRIALKPAAVLASWGVIATVFILGMFAMFYLGVDWKLGLLMAAIVGSTDAAAVFSLLRNSGVRLNARIQATLELESGINDPMAILLVSVFISLIVTPMDATFGSIILTLIKQLGFGLLFGLVAGKILAILLAKIRLVEGLYALLIASGGLLVFALTNLADGSGFLAVYLVGVMVGNSRNSSTQHVLNVMDGLVWLAQAVMFLVLGLLVMPSRMWLHGWDALVIAGCLIFVARPLAVWTSIKWFKYSRKEFFYISWVGLRGAVPITLAIMPMMSGVHKNDAQLLFDVAFAVVILSLLIQGTTIPVFAKKLGMVLPEKPEPLDNREVWLADKLAVNLLSFEVSKGSDAEHSHPYAMTRQFSEGRLFALIRAGETVNVNLSTQMQAGDVAWYVLPEAQGDEFALQFASADKQLDEQQFYGEFEVKPDVKVGELAFAYGLKVDESVADKTLREAFRQYFGDVPVAGDSLDWDGVRVTVKELDEQSYVKSFGLKLPKK
ncbi:potassium/proton antiporter [Alysiella crassa]|uniref:Potassium/proton antiporter n=1 Tax=Alysiella crassa TaxID=153491 RepID=A0A376BKN2_9NEIS|nr:potassium/proton antiporter [Alysiella crassa]UOP07583.1 potassium/proton antiporter [Alysiella crassa]SSY70198.1 potassium/proton antiporter [Alysiella crassa]